VRKVKGIRANLKRWYRFVDKPRYYKYAHENVKCQCPLCNCPNRNMMFYSFVYVDEEKGLIYYDIPKCASKTIRSELFNNDHDLSLTDPKNPLDRYVKFSFVRNPWDRMVSNWKMFTTVPWRIEQLRSMTTEDVSRFEEFVHFANRVRNHHWQPQSLFLPDELDFLGHLETFDEDYARLSEMIGAPPSQLEKSNTTKKGLYWEYYTPSALEVVSEMYAEDVRRFGYTFGAEQPR